MSEAWKRRRGLPARTRPGRAILLAALLAGLAGALLSACGPAGVTRVAGDDALRVSRSHLVIGPGAGRTVQLRGVNRSGLEDKCVQGSGFFDSPTPTQPDSPTMVSAMRSWDIDVVRVPLNEGCWLGRGAPAAYSGPAYRQAVEAYVRELNDDGLFVILSLQWLTIDGSAADLQPPMPDATLGPRFWQSVSATFRDDPDVLFDLYNEPFGVSWSCWRDGCEVPTGSAAGAAGGTQTWQGYAAAGMQQLVDAVRAGGSHAPLLLSGLAYGLDLSGWLTDAPSDPDDDLIAAVHSYGGGAEAVCDDSCETTLVGVARHVPVVFSELGEKDCADGYVDSLMDFADAHGIGYLGWAWDATDTGWSCTQGPALISSYDGTPTAYGIGFRTHFRALGPAVGPGAASVPASTSTTGTATTGRVGTTGASTTTALPPVGG